MPALASVTIADGQATPVSHTFTPAGILADGTGQWIDRDHSTPVGFYRMTQRLRSPLPPAKGAVSNSRVYRFVEKISIPVVALVDGVETKVGENTAEVTFVLMESSTEAQRKDLRAFVRNSLNLSPATLAIDSLEGVW